METVELAHLDAFAQKMVALLPIHKKTAALITLSGDLGAGKTTFTQAFAQVLGVGEVLQSPTYVLMKSYHLPKNATLPFAKLVHIDAYRLEKPEQFAALEPETFLNDPQNIVCIEWPERVVGQLPPADLALRFSSEGVPEGERSVEVEKLV